MKILNLLWIVGLSFGVGVTTKGSFDNNKYTREISIVCALAFGVALVAHILVYYLR